MGQETLKDLEKRYNDAVKDGDNEFAFQGHVIVTGYCKYLLEYHRMIKTDFNVPFKFAEMKHD